MKRHNVLNDDVIARSFLITQTLFIFLCLPFVKLAGWIYSRFIYQYENVSNIGICALTIFIIEYIMYSENLCEREFNFRSFLVLLFISMYFRFTWLLLCYGSTVYLYHASSSTIILSNF